MNSQIPKAPVAKRAVQVTPWTSRRNKREIQIQIGSNSYRWSNQIWVFRGYNWGERNDVLFLLFADSNVYLMGLVVAVRILWRGMKCGRWVSGDGTAGEWRNGSFEAIEECWPQVFAAEVRGRQEEAKTGGGSEDGSYSTNLTERFTSEYQWSKLLKRKMEEINQKKIIPI